MLKAKIIVQDEPKTTIEVMYNPTELSDNYQVQVAGTGSNIEFKKLQRDKFTLSLFVDTYEQKTDVREVTKKIEALLKPSVGTDKKLRPPICEFVWSKDAWFTGVIVALAQRYTLFLSTGEPVRAQLKVTFQSVLSEQEELQALGLWNCRKFWVVNNNDRLDLVAYKTLGDAKLWQLIAEENNIEDPLHFPLPSDIGKTLIIPDLH